MQASACAAKASFSSTRSSCSTRSPARCERFAGGGNGPESHDSSDRPRPPRWRRRAPAARAPSASAPRQRRRQGGGAVVDAAGVARRSRCRPRDECGLQRGQAVRRDSGRGCSSRQTRWTAARRRSPPGRSHRRRRLPQGRLRPGAGSPARTRPARSRVIPYALGHPLGGFAQRDGPVGVHPRVDEAPADGGVGHAGGVRSQALPGLSIT